MPKARRKSPRTSKRTKTNAADERAGAVIESLTSDVDAKEKMLEEMTLAGKGRKDFSPVILLLRGGERFREEGEMARKIGRKEKGREKNRETGEPA